MATIAECPRVGSKKPGARTGRETCLAEGPVHAGAPRGVLSDSPVGARLLQFADECWARRIVRDGLTWKFISPPRKTVSRIPLAPEVDPLVQDMLKKGVVEPC